ncbi:hypothetical protein [Pedobacter nototheniae]|uniref:hypothetical protein n=1 Tax=Pedobacter nototheniae TaxID=2488994 RepID=UPI00103DC921|nr:hypothetical protein [Pedobacter nototheniae]
MKFLSFVIVVSLCLISFFSKADVGCQSNSSQTIYLNRNGIKNGVPNYDYRSSSDRVPISSAYCVTAGSNGPGSCYITSYLNTASDNPNGILVTFYLVNCPIDNYSLILLFFCGALGFDFLSNNEPKESILTK